jgi:hypothetical protein
VVTAMDIWSVNNKKFQEGVKIIMNQDVIAA